MIVHKPVIVFVLSLVLTGLSACSPRALHEAEEVVRTADSLRAAGQMYGIDTGDSATLAQAYETLGKQPFVLCTSSLCTSYAHACYHYGRLLREKDNPVAAMECFINASHAHTRDYHILGRVYSNMGDICHLAGEYPLSYEMYKLSGEMYLKNKDTLLYYYDLNNMAFELALLGDKDSSYHIINRIDQQKIDRYAEMKINETKAEACLRACQYDSAIYYTSLFCSGIFVEPTGLLIRAQAFSRQEENDSAVYYANQVLSLSNEVYNENNALYILTNMDDKKDSKAIREVASERADVQKQIEIKRSRLAQAVQLLEQDLNKGFDWITWLAVLLIMIILIGFTILPLRIRRHKLQTQKQVKEIVDKQANNVLESIRKHIDITNLNSTLHWRNYKEMKADADLYLGGIVTQLESYNLNEIEVRFCILTILDFQLRKIADILCYSFPSGIKTLKKRIANKLGTTPPELKDFLLRISIKS